MIETLLALLFTLIILVLYALGLLSLKSLRYLMANVLIFISTAFPSSPYSVPYHILPQP